MRPEESPRSIVALLPFLVKGALSLSVLRAMRDRGFDVTICFYLWEAVGYSRDPAGDFSSEGRLISMSDAPGRVGVERLLRLLGGRRNPLLVQIGAPAAYKQIPYIKEQLPELCVLDTLYNPVGHTISHFLYESAFDGVIVESVAMRDYIIRNTSSANKTVHLVESGIPLDLFTPVKGRSAARRPLTIGYLGRLSPEKNPLGFVELADHLHGVFPTLRFLMFGEGGMEEEVRSRAASGPAASAIKFNGYIPHARDALCAMDVLVVPSKLDGRPNTIMEANACGVPVIAAPVGGIPELVEEGINGYLAEARNYPRIEELVRIWLDHPKALSDLRRSARIKAERDFDRRRMLDDYAAVFAADCPR